MMWFSQPYIAKTLHDGMVVKVLAAMVFGGVLVVPPVAHADRAEHPGSAVKAQRSDYWIPNPDGSFFGERTLTMEGAGCAGEGPGTHWLPISLTPAQPPAG